MSTEETIPMSRDARSMAQTKAAKARFTGPSALSGRATASPSDSFSRNTRHESWPLPPPGRCFPARSGAAMARPGRPPSPAPAIRPLRPFGSPWVGKGAPQKSVAGPPCHPKSHGFPAGHFPRFPTISRHFPRFPGPPHPPGKGSARRSVAALLRVVARHGAAVARHGRPPSPAPATRPFLFTRRQIFLLERTSLHFSPRGEAKCVRGPSGLGASRAEEKGASRLARAGVLEQYVEHGKQAQRSRIACFDRRVVCRLGPPTMVFETRHGGFSLSLRDSKESNPNPGQRAHEATTNHGFYGFHETRMGRLWRGMGGRRPPRRRPVGFFTTRITAFWFFPVPPVTPRRATPTPASGFSRITSHETRITAFMMMNDDFPCAKT